MPVILRRQITIKPNMKTSVVLYRSVCLYYSYNIFLFKRLKRELLLKHFDSQIALKYITRLEFNLNLTYLFRFDVQKPNRANSDNKKSQNAHYFLTGCRATVSSNRRKKHLCSRPASKKSFYNQRNY